MNEAQLKQNIIRKLEDMGQQKLTFLDSLIDNLDRYLPSKNTHLAQKKRIKGSIKNLLAA